MAKKKYERPPEPETRRPALSPEKKSEMLAVLIRNDDAFNATQEMLTVKLLRKYWSVSHAMIWKVARSFYSEHGELPDRSQLVTEISNAASNSSVLTDEEVEEINDFLEYAFDPDPAEHGPKFPNGATYTRSATKTCKQFLEEVHATELKERLTQEDTLPIDLPAMLADAQIDLDRIQSLNDVEVDVPFPDNWDKREDVQLFTSGVPALNDFMGGGWRGGEVLLFMGPFGSGKTVTTVHAIAESIKHAAGLWAEGKVKHHPKTGEPLRPVAVLIFTESNIDEYRMRIMSNLARVPWQRLASMTSLKSLDDGDTPGEIDATKYELREFRADIKAGAAWENEQERIKRARRLANQHLLVLDCTDSKDNPNQIGRGGMVEVANVINGVFRRKQECYPSCFWLDHISGLMDRMAEVDDDESKLRRVLTTMPLLAGDKIGKAWGVPIGLLHQLSGAANARSATAKFHHADAEGSKSIGKYAVFAVTSGPTDANQMAVWRCTKHRRQPPSGEKIVKVDGQFNRIIDCTETHGISAGQRMIMEKSELDAYSSMKKATKTAPENHGTAEDIGEV